MRASLDILMVAPQPFFRPRGTPVSVLHRIRALRRLGHRVELLTYPFGTDPDLDGVGIRRTRRTPLVADVPIGPSVAKALLDVPLFVEAHRSARSFRYDLIHTHEEAGFLGALVSRRYGIPHVYDMHSSLPQQFPTFGRYHWRPVVRAFETLERFTLRHSQGVITVYPHLYHQVRGQGFSGPLTLLENTLDFEKEETDPEERERLRMELGLDGRAAVVYTGTLEPYQGMDILLAAARVLEDRRAAVTVVTVGGTAGQVDELRGHAARLGLGDGFRAVPQVPPHQVFRYHDLADALVTCRVRGRNTPLKIYQYLRSRRPIVATAIPSHTQVLNREVAELVPPSPRGVARGIERVLDDPGRSRALAERAAELRRERYSEEAYLENLDSFLKDVRMATTPVRAGDLRTGGS